MRAILTAIKDELSEFSVPIPILVQSEDQKTATLKRFFRDYIDGNSFMKKNPEDFSLWIVGEFDTLTGKVTNLDFPELVERAKGYGNKEDTVQITNGSTSENFQ